MLHASLSVLACLLVCLFCCCCCFSFLLVVWFACLVVCLSFCLFVCLFVCFLFVCLFEVEGLYWLSALLIVIVLWSSFTKSSIFYEVWGESTHFSAETFHYKYLPYHTQDVNFMRSYNKSPTVLLTAKHSTSGGNAAAECNGIVGWIEVILKAACAISIKGDYLF